MHLQDGKVVVKDLYKIFGTKSNRALPLLEQGVSKEEIYKSTGLSVGVQGASFTIYEGEIFVIMGLSGSGKSTLVRMLNRLIEPNAGSVIVDGKDITAMSHDELVQFRLHNMSMVFQSFALMPHLTVLENTAFGLKLSGVPEEQRNIRAKESLEQVGLSGWENASPSQLSGGMQQRVGLARALAVDPEIMLMDEAFSALDPLIRAEMQDELLNLQQQHQRTIIFISHDLDEAIRIGDRIAIMQDGVVVQVGSAEEILRSPANDYVKSFFKGVDPTGILTTQDIVLNNHPTLIITKGGNIPATQEYLSNSDRDYCYILTPEKKLIGVVSSESLRTAAELGNASSTLTEAYLDDVVNIGLRDVLTDIQPIVAGSPCPVPVLNDDGRFMGVVSKSRFLRILHQPERILHSVEEVCHA
ncbi:glycine betaine/L-proline ABC transporter ATP-binding protein ProV [Halodesulfovibrio sp. MK-HDV]|jgi:glycine betaine/proline transport system ATP-binding protein|uniref:glycine betaine/L-proline ABC transporter ATP-binding protein ProV n=1 Tax=Halodesulfovibrio sp. MK-HDV TaxID=2599925 RepID=UPI00136D076E|nr:glycine betaine/L-proline ABC transporter ATP-binding protein ProV [Halodesulfovibrio sp. MK-HDV]KAF1074865.1 Glycine betaine/proline betaine transport system ATP-binding protein ProV [Halodesulfovibrio sp. MK-HDV]